MAVYRFVVDTTPLESGLMHIHQDHAADLLKVAKKSVGGWTELVSSCDPAHAVPEGLVYPDWSQVIPAANAPLKGPLGMNIQYLASIAKYCKSVGVGVGRRQVLLECGGPEKCLKFSTGIPGFTYYLMPMKV